MTTSAWLISTLIAASVCYLGFAGFVWANHRGVASRPLVVMLIALKIWTLCYAIELSTRTVDVAQWWSGLKFVGIVLLPPGLWAFVHEYTGRGPLPRKWLLLMSIEPLLVLIALATPLHDTIHVYADPPARLLGAPVPAAGDLFFLHAGYTYIVMLSAVVVLLAKLTRIAPAYRRQGAVLMVFSVLPFVTNAVWNYTRLSKHWIDPTPLVFGLTAIVMVWGFFRLKLLDLVPVARGIVIEQMTDGLIVLDVYGRIADANTSAAALVGLTPAALIGRPAVAVLPALQPMLEAPDQPSGGPVLAEVTIEPAAPDDNDPASFAGEPLPAGPRDVAVSVTPVTDQIGRQVARSLVLRDVTQRNRTERQLRQLLEEQTKLSETMRQTLRPAQLPPVPHLRLAARSVPSARGGGVGGDFYDVHSIPNGRSAFVLGDVSGKGVRAAVVTSLARYTVRTLSAQGFSPRKVLNQLNRALLDQDDDERFCTVVYGHVLPATSGRSGVRLILALGGHPQPLVRRREGTVHAVGVPGTALGLLPQIDVTEVVVDLAAGDVLLAYTDGVTEARNGEDQFGEDGLAAVLARVQVNEVAARPAARSLAVVTGLSAAEPILGDVAGEPDDAEEDARRAGLLADAVADSVLSAVGGFSSERDDVALLVLAAT